ncbi:MAG: hypothetical protein ACN4GW_13115 [Desulforhopalus sp.]
MNKNKLKKTALLLVIFALAPIVTIAYSKSEDSRRPQGPPPEAIKACEGKNPGETTTFKGRRGESLTATCKEIEGQLAAVPEGGPR